MLEGAKMRLKGFGEQRCTNGFFDFLFRAPWRLRVFVVASRHSPQKYGGRGEVKEIPVTDTLDLHTIPPRDIKPLVEEYLQLCVEKGFRLIRIIHGKGTGFQRQAVRSVLEKSELVESFEDGPDWGSTAALLKKHEGTRTQS